MDMVVKANECPFGFMAQVSYTLVWNKKKFAGGFTAFQVFMCLSSLGKRVDVLDL